MPLGKFLFIFFLNIACLHSDDYTIADLIGKDDQVKKIVNELLEKNDYQVLDQNLSIQYKPDLIILTANTNQGKKFLKLHNKGLGAQEYQGALFLKDYLPVITGECLIASNNLDLIVTPYFETIDQEKGMLFDVINLLDPATLHVANTFWKHFQDMLLRVLSMTKGSLQYCIKPCLNDRLYFDRLKYKSKHQLSGRVEAFYESSNIQLPFLTLPWKDLIKKKWIVDGVAYQESLRDLIEMARTCLDPTNTRLISICHGDWHDMNIHVKKSDDHLEEFVLLDCELAGENCVLGDAMVYLVYEAIQGDYLTPKYHSNQFVNHQEALRIAQENFQLKLRKIHAQVDGSTIILKGIGSFGTCETRRIIAKKFIDNYFEPLIAQCIQSYPQVTSDQIESTLKACFLMRLLAVYNISTMEPMDQAKIFGLILKGIGTPIAQPKNKMTLQKILEAL